MLISSIGGEVYGKLKDTLIHDKVTDKSYAEIKGVLRKVFEKSILFY